MKTILFLLMIVGITAAARIEKRAGGGSHVKHFGGGEDDCEDAAGAGHLEHIPCILFKDYF